MSINSLVRQTWEVWVLALKGEFPPVGIDIPGGNGDFCHVIVVVISQSPGF